DAVALEPDAGATPAEGGVRRVGSRAVRSARDRRGRLRGTTVTVVTTRTRTRPDVRLALPVLAGIGMLLLRLRILQTPDATRVALLAVVFLTILVTSLLVPVPLDAPRLQ